MPTTGPAILCANHLSVIDSVVVAIVVPRGVRYLGKREYFVGLVGVAVRAPRRDAGRQGGRDRRRGQPGTRRRRARVRGVARGLPGGHPLTRWPAVPRQDRAGAARDAHARSHRADRSHRHARGDATPQPAAQAGIGDGAFRATAAVPTPAERRSPFRARRHRRGDARDHDAVGSDVRGRLRGTWSFSGPGRVERRRSGGRRTRCWVPIDHSPRDSDGGRGRSGQRVDVRSCADPRAWVQVGTGRSRSIGRSV